MPVIYSQEPIKLDIQGHRGARGLYPENSIPAFKHALELGVNTLELDVVISQDHEVVVSHEPFFSHEICQHPDGRDILKEEEEQLNLYSMSYDSIKAYDCGSKFTDKFPEQKETVCLQTLA